MAVKIGSKYLEQLATLAHLVRYERSGGFYEDQEVIICPSAESILYIEEELGMHIKRKCWYDKCPDKSVEADKNVQIRYDDGRHVQNYFFHSGCLDALVADERFPKSLN